VEVAAEFGHLESCFYLLPSDDPLGPQFLFNSINYSTTIQKDSSTIIMARRKEEKSGGYNFDYRQGQVFYLFSKHY
jgi:hypothetical protein